MTPASDTVWEKVWCETVWDKDKVWCETVWDKVSCETVWDNVWSASEQNSECIANVTYWIEKETAAPLPLSL